MSNVITPRAEDNLTGICNILLTMSEDMITALNAGFQLGYQAGQSKEAANDRSTE